MKKLVGEFKEFALKGNVIDMAVGVIIGGAFGKIVTSLVNDVVMPALGVITGRVNLASLMFTVNIQGEGDPIQIRYGAFLQNILDFIIVAVCIFFFARMVNLLRKRQEERRREEKRVKEEAAAKTAAAQPPVPPAPSKEETLLTEIRDILKNK